MASRGDSRGKSQRGRGHGGSRNSTTRDNPDTRGPPPQDPQHLSATKLHQETLLRSGLNESILSYAVGSHPRATQLEKILRMSKDSSYKGILTRFSDEHGSIKPDILVNQMVKLRRLAGKTDASVDFILTPLFQALSGSNFRPQPADGDEEFQETL